MPAPSRRAERDAWVDVPMDHDPELPADSTDFDRGVGLDGYERGTDGPVAKRPGLRRPGDKDPVATPFED